MDVTPIESKRDYRRALKEIEGLMDAKRGTPDGDRLGVLVTLVEAWEARHDPIDLPADGKCPGSQIAAARLILRDGPSALLRMRL